MAILRYPGINANASHIWPDALLTVIFCSIDLFRPRVTRSKTHHYTLAHDALSNSSICNKQPLNCAKCTIRNTNAEPSNLPGYRLSTHTERRQRHDAVRATIARYRRLQDGVSGAPCRFIHQLSWPICTALCSPADYD